MSTLYHAKKEICSLSSVCQIVQGKNFVQNSITFLLNSKDLWLSVAYRTTLGFSWCTLIGISEDKLTQEESRVNQSKSTRKKNQTHHCKQNSSITKYTKGINLFKFCLSPNTSDFNPFVVDRTSCVIYSDIYSTWNWKHMTVVLPWRQAFISWPSLGSAYKDGIMDQTAVLHLWKLTIYIQVENSVFLSCRISSHTSVFSCIRTESAGNV